MTFSVKAMDSPSPQLSPSMHLYVSPQMLPQAGARVPAMSLSDDHPPAKRVGTDPTKYKTTICRNWEQTGTCTFRGCTFAHGAEELRAPTRAEYGVSPMLRSQYVSPGSTPPLMAANTSGGPPKLEALLEMLYSEVTRERELVTVHMEANRTLEGMLRREQAQHAEARALLEERRAEYATLLDVVARQNALLEGLLGQQSASTASDGARGLVERTTALLQAGGVGPVASVDRTVAMGSGGGDGVEPKKDDLVSDGSSDGEEVKEREKERIEELLRALQQQH